VIVLQEVIFAGLVIHSALLPVPLENLERSERMRVTSFIISSMLTTLMTLLATLSSIFRSRTALELENLALRHQIGVLRRTAAKRLKLTSADLCLAKTPSGFKINKILQGSVTLLHRC